MNKHELHNVRRIATSLFGSCAIVGVIAAGEQHHKADAAAANIARVHQLHTESSNQNFLDQQSDTKTTAQVNEVRLYVGSACAGLMPIAVLLITAGIGSGEETAKPQSAEPIFSAE